MIRNAEKYPFIKLWGKQMGSYDYYIQGVIDKAIKTKAPYDAIYERDGRWSRVRDMKNAELQAQLYESHMTSLKNKLFEITELTTAINKDLIPEEECYNVLLGILYANLDCMGEERSCEAQM